MEKWESVHFGGIGISGGGGSGGRFFDRHTRGPGRGPRRIDNLLRGRISDFIFIAARHLIVVAGSGAILGLGVTEG
jgi:hypothetical protein